MHILLSVFTIVMLSFPAMSADFMPPRTAADQVARDLAILVDVRESNEIAAGMAEPALWMPTTKIKAGGAELETFLKGLNATKTIIVYCRSGARSSQFVTLLESRGFTAANMGAYDSWKKAGLPIKMPN